MRALVLVLPLLLPACGAPALSAAERADLYQANVTAAQATCVAMLQDGDVPHTQAIEDWCVLVLQSKDGCPALTAP